MTTFHTTHSVRHNTGGMVIMPHRPTSWCTRCEFCVKVEGVIHAIDDWFERWRDLPPEQFVPADCREERVLLDLIHTRRPSTCQQQHLSTTSSSTGPARNNNTCQQHLLPLIQHLTTTPVNNISSHWSSTCQQHLPAPNNNTHQQHLPLVHHLATPVNNISSQHLTTTCQLH